jgi:hypothetical protein
MNRLGPRMIYRGDDARPETDLLVLEYEQLKEEQRVRIASRDNLIYVTLVAIAAVGATALQARTVTVLLALPPVCLALGWAHANNDRKVWEIGHYIRVHTAPRLMSLHGASSRPFEWEFSHRANHGGQRRFMQTSASLLVFCAPAIASAVANIPHAITAPAMIAVMAPELGMIALLIYAILTNTDRATDRTALSHGLGVGHV